MKVSLVQLEPQLGKLQANIEQATALINQTDSDLYILPELANSGYNFKNREAALAIAESADNSRYLDALCDVAKQKNTLIVTGFCEKEGDKLFNSSVLLGPGGPIGIYRKLHLFLNEKNIFEPGKIGLPVFDTDWGKIGMLVCFDWMFPEAWRKLAMNGAQLIAHPSNLVLPYCQKVVPSYALINRCYVATANRIGTEGELTFSGRSIVADPNGDILCLAQPDKSQVISAEVDLSLTMNKFITKRNHVFDDRRSDVYGNLNPHD